MNQNKDILLIDKPKGWTSFDVVAKIRNAYRRSTGNRKAKVGHAGTLDPFATGLLILLLGDATKRQDEFMKLDKEYEAELKFGYTSTTGDPEGEIIPYSHNQAIITPETVFAVTEAFRGKISQTPSIYSAIKINGQRAYQLARKGQNVEVKPRNVTIYEIFVLKYEFPLLKIKVKCSSGTYIRSLAEDIGKKLSCGAYLTALRRTKIGQYDFRNILFFFFS